MRATPRWVVFDYGGVICQPFQAWSALGALLAAPVADVEVAYWRHRPAYDLDSDDAHYWGTVAAEVGSSVDPDLVRLLVTTDVGGWSHLADGVESLLADVRRDGVDLALLSNAPASLADAVDRQGWAAPFRHRLFSSGIGASKPEPAAFSALVKTLDAAPDRCVFFDDRIENVEGASEFGLRAHRWNDVGPARVTLSEYGLTRN